MKDDGGPAFPLGVIDAHGMSLRDWFAGQVINMASHDLAQSDDVAQRAYEIADAMLKARKA